MYKTLNHSLKKALVVVLKVSFGMCFIDVKLAAVAHSENVSVVVLPVCSLRSTSVLVQISRYPVEVFRLQIL